MKLSLGSLSSLPRRLFRIKGSYVLGHNPSLDWIIILITTLACTALIVAFSFIYYYSDALISDSFSDETTEYETYSKDALSRVIEYYNMRGSVDGEGIEVPPDPSL